METNTEIKKIPDTIKFLRQKDYKFIRKLGQGACGETILIEDEAINEQFVCKKYLPCYEEYRATLYNRFVDEIKILHKLGHKNIVRVFNYYIYPDSLSGYILMEFIQGTTIDNYIKNKPENINEIFEQTIDAFAYLEEKKILHRDIRFTNIMITDASQVKIIDFGFSKPITEKGDSNKSISLNRWCEPPNEFNDKKYDSKTEVYFIGKLFEDLIQKGSIESFQYTVELSKMCQKEPIKRIQSFFKLQQAIKQNLFLEIDFSEEDADIYRSFSSAVIRVVNSINHDAKYNNEIEIIIQRLDELYKKTMLEQYISKNSHLIDCFVLGGYNYSTARLFEVSILKNFLKLLKTSSPEKRKIILNNLYFRLDSIDRCNPQDDFNEEIPF